MSMSMLKPRIGRFVLGKTVSAQMWTQRQAVRAVEKLRCEEGQGTVEYAIILGVIAVIAMLVIMAFRSKIQELWTAIQTGINGLSTSVST